jgi:hypothetical protein
MFGGTRKIWGQSLNTELWGVFLEKGKYLQMLTGVHK